jgi:hypothetical protein
MQIIYEFEVCKTKIIEIPRDNGNVYNVTSFHSFFLKITKWVYVQFYLKYFSVFKTREDITKTWRVENNI